MDVLMGLIGTLAVCAWLTSAWSALMMLKARDRARPLSWFAFHGMAFFTGDGFVDGGQPWRRRFLLAAALFFACCLAGVAVGAAYAAPSPT